MNFYRRRPLALIITICVLAAATIYFIPGYLKLAFILLCAALAPTVAFILKRRGITSICNLSATSFVLICAVLMVVMALISFAYFDVHVARYDTLTKGSIKATVTSVESRTAYGAVYKVQISERDGKTERAKGLIGTDSAVEFNVGDVIKADVEFCKPVDFYSYRSASRFELVADGIAFTANTVGSVELCGKNNGIYVRLAKLREFFSANIATYLDKESAPLADALFLGNRGELGKIKRDFMYIGAMHILALSGLHLSVVAGGFERLLQCLGIGTKVRYILTVMLAFFYVALTGFVASATRAAIMLTLAYIAAILDADSDRITSLFIAVGLIVLFNPTAIFDISLQLSFAATLGLLLVSEPAYRLSNRLAPSARSNPMFRFMIRLACDMAASLGAVMFVLPLQWFYFGEFSLMSPLATLVMAPICEALLVLIPPLLICSLLSWHFACGIIAGAIRAVTDVCADVADTLCEHSELISLEYPFALPVIIICTATIIYMAVRGCRNWLYALIPFAVSVAIFLGGVYIYNAVYDGFANVDVVSGTSSEAIVLTSKCSAAVILIGEDSAQAVYGALDFLPEHNLTRIETLVLTDVSRRCVNSVRKLLNYRKVGTIFIPIPKNEYSSNLSTDIAELASEYNSRLIFYDRESDSSMVHGDVSVNIAGAAKLSRSERALTALTFEYGDTTAAYVGASVWEDAEAWGLVNGAKYMIFGSCGPIIKGSPDNTVLGTTDVIYILDSSFVAVLTPWLDGFSGTVITGKEHSFALKP